MKIKHCPLTTSNFVSWREAASMMLQGVRPTSDAAGTEVVRLALYHGKEDAQAVIPQRLAKTWISRLHLQSSETIVHSIKTAFLTAVLCDALGASQDERAITTGAALLHDIGKVFIASAILSKSSALTEQEYRQVQEHSILGCNLLYNLRMPREIASVALMHHERWDGHGYPNSLSGKDIPFPARIVALCDSVEAMEANRCYRHSLTDAEIRHEIVRCSGLQFDPALVAKLLDVWDLAQSPNKVRLAI